MKITDLFAWLQSSIYGDLGAPVSTVRRNLQVAYEAALIGLMNKPEAGTPSDAQALARFELENLRGRARHLAARRSLDMMTLAHLRDLEQRANAALRS
jgi:hypothetical protein